MLPAHLSERYGAQFSDASVDAVDPDDLVKLVFPIYEKHFTERKIRETIEFHRGPRRQKVLRRLPAWRRHALAWGGSGGRQPARRVIEKARAGSLETR